jgi:hypothetical protein
VYYAYSYTKFYSNPLNRFGVIFSTLVCRRRFVFIDFSASKKVLLTLGFVSPCILIYSNKSTNQMQKSLRFTACRLNTAQHVSGILMPIIRSLSTAVVVSGLPLERGGSSAVGRCRSGPTTTNNTATTTSQR